MRRIGTNASGFSMPMGAREALGRIQSMADVEVGILTGNWEAPGRLKLELAQVDHERFSISAWAEDGVVRNDLVPVARARFREHHGAEPTRIIVIGDTPRDIQCAHAHDAIGVGVATGIHSVEELRNAGADLAIENLLEFDQLKALLRPQ